MTEPSNEPSGSPCDVNDVLCQLRALTHLKGLNVALGNDKFKEEFPELKGLEDKIRTREASLTSALGKCGISPAELPSFNFNDVPKEVTTNDQTRIEDTEV